MYTAYYKLSGRPFKLSPDSRFFFGSRPHKKAMAYLTYGLSQGEGFIVITGNIGTGKSTLIDYLFSQINTGRFIASKVVTTHLEADDFLRMVASGFGIGREGADKATLLREIEAFLVANWEAGKRVLLVVDEAQNLPSHSLEELRMLSNYQRGEHPLLQIYLVGQPQFRRTLAHAEMEQLRQRVIASHHLEPLDAEQTRQYIEHRLGLVGWHEDNPAFTDGAYTRIFERTGGVPRRINLLCDRLLLFGYLEEKTVIDDAVVGQVADDLEEEEIRPGVGRDHSPAATPPANKKKRRPRKKKAPPVAYATQKSVEELAGRIERIEQQLNGHRYPVALHSTRLLPAVARLTRAVDMLAPMPKENAPQPGEATVDS